MLHAYGDVSICSRRDVQRNTIAQFPDGSKRDYDTSQEYGSSSESEWFLFVCSKGQYIVSGSDDGSFFIWEKETTNLVRILQGDESIVNCLQPHPNSCFLATSGIDPVVRLWSPRPEVNSRRVFRNTFCERWGTTCVSVSSFHYLLLKASFTITTDSVSISYRYACPLPRPRRQRLRTGEWWRTWIARLRPTSGA